MLDVVCIGAATEDLFFFSDSFEIADQKVFLPWGEKFAVGRLERRFGGGAFNAAVACSRLGLGTALFGRVGNDRPGAAIKEFLEGERVSTKFLAVDSGFKTSTSALLSSGGERAIVMFRGENDNLLDTSPDWDEVLDCRWLLVIDLAGTNNDLLFEVVERAGTRGIKLAYVPGQGELRLGKERLKPVFAAASVLVLNLYEAGMILGKRGGGAEEMLSEFRKLGVEMPVITKGPKGSVAYDGSQFYYQEATPKVRVVDRTGAGDAFSSTFTAGVVLGRAVPEALLLAAKNSSSVVTRVGGTDGLLALSALERFGEDEE